MKVAEVVKIAIDSVASLYASEKVTNLGLEEVYFDEEYVEWVVTVGFSRPWDYPEGTGLAALAMNSRPSRSFKVLRVRDSDGHVLSVRNWNP